MRLSEGIMPKLTVDGIEVEVPPGSTVLQAAEAAGKEIPRFCYHERLSIAGNCRMCLVEIEKSPKPVASCAMPAGDGMVVKTATPMVRKAREGVMEFLLINHPLDCPICDQGGECDLQDQAMGYGHGNFNRFHENKRAVEEKHMGPLIKTVMTRCIHCTRCVRFSTEVAGVVDLGLIGRGEDAEITTYLEKALASELSGNVVDLCPVGALTSKPYAFTARPWELRKTESIDVMDALGSAIRVDARGPEVLRVLPRINEAVNEEWISDKTRHACDGLKRQRLDTPYVRVNGKLAPATWAQAFDAIATKIKATPPDRIGAIVGDLACAESMVALKDLFGKIGSPNLDGRQDGAPHQAGNRAAYVFNPTIAGIEAADVILLVGTNPRVEASVLNARIRKRWRKGPVSIAVIGPRADLTYPYDYLGAGPQTLTELVNGSHPFAEILSNAKTPLVIVGQGALARADGAAIQALLSKLTQERLLRDSWNGLGILHDAAARVGALDLGLVPGPAGKSAAEMIAAAGQGAFDVLYLLGADEVDVSHLGQAFVIYQGSHGDKAAHRADVILPGAAYTEKNATYVNTEGRVQRARRAAFPPGQAKEDWTILRALSEVLGQRLPYDDLAAIRRRLVEVAPTFGSLDTITPSAFAPFGVEGAVSNQPFVSSIGDFYLTNAIARASAVMAECSHVFNAPAHTGTHG
jgi:NADH-quinone oxidoreductase subunit G